VVLVVAANYPFLDVVWTMFVFFAWVIWIWLLFIILGDIFRRHDVSGWSKAAWVLFVIILPFIGVLVYLGVNGAGISERNERMARVAQSQMDEHIRDVTETGPADEIEKAKRLLDSGAISAEEYAALKQKALATT
jgi:Short C-terminal domain/Phospholipase_D-nuclease N-terminal